MKPGKLSIKNGSGEIEVISCNVSFYNFNAFTNNKLWLILGKQIFPAFYMEGEDGYEIIICYDIDINKDSRYVRGVIACPEKAEEALALGIMLGKHGIVGVELS